MTVYNERLCEERHKKIEERFENIEKLLDKQDKVTEQIQRMAISMERIAFETKQMREDFNELAPRVKVLEDKPIKKYEQITMTIVTILIGAVMGVFLAQIGLK